ncbi:MAG: helix-turn-helix domain-containing protein [Pseudomonadota bacterium]
MTKRHAGPAAPGVGRLSPKLRGIVKRLAADTPALSARLVDTLHGSISDYSSLHDRRALEDVQRSCRLNVDLWYGSLLSGRPPTAAQLEQIAAYGRHRVRQGVSLAAFLQAFRVGTWLFWETLLDAAKNDAEVNRELLHKVSPYNLYHFDLLGQTVSRAYIAEQSRQHRWRDRLRYELCDVIYSNPDNLAGFGEKSQALGLDAAAPHVALAVKLKEEVVDLLGTDADAEDHLAPLLAAVVGRAPASVEGVLWTRRHGHLLVWQPLPAHDTRAAGEGLILERAAQAMQGSADIVAIGLGLPETGPLGWRRSADQSIKAIELGMRMGLPDALFRYADIALEDLVSGSESFARHCENLMARLGSEPELLDTLAAYFEHRQQRKPASFALDIHPNTLTYRLHRIETLLELRLDDAGCIAVLHTALRLRRLAQRSTRH